MNPLVAQIVDRCHVSRSNRDVITEVVSRMRHGRRTFLAQPKASRRRIMMDAILRHQLNRGLYRDVRGARLF